MNAMNGTLDSSNANALTFDEAKDSDVMADSQKGHQSLVEWLDKMLPYLKLSLEASAEDLRMCLMDGTVLCSLLNQLSPGSIIVGGSYEPAREKLERFLTAMDEMTLPRFELSDLERGDMAPVLQSLKALKASFSNGEFDRNLIYLTRSWSMPKEVDQSKVQETNFGEVFYTSISDARILELMKSMKSSNFQNASTQSLFDMLNKILDESTERMNGNVSHGVASILRTIVQVAEQRVSTQAENLKNQNILFRIREEKYRSRIKVLEMLATGTTEENEIVTNRLEHVKIEKAKAEEKEKLEEKDVIRLTKEKDRNDNEISKLKQELEVLKRAHEKQCSELEARAEKSEVELEKKLDKLEICLDDSRKRVKELEKFWESRSRKWEKKESSYRSFMSSHSTALQDLKGASESIRLEVLKTQKSYYQDFNYFGLKLRLLGDAAKNYQLVLEENRRLYNEVQDLKGNIRVYCRIKPFLPGQNKKETTIEYIGENGELVIVNPLKQGKDNHRLFKFKKVFGPKASQEEVFLDTRPLVRSVLDGYNVCIFAYGQTGSGKTYTMSGPSISSEQDWGVNYRALNDLFQMSQSRLNSITYEVGVQMIEIYNEQVRDLLSNGGSQRSLGIRNIAQPDGLAVPDAIMHSVKSTEDVVELMNIGSRNRAVSATVLNERSSRSHSVLTVHVRGMDMDTDSVLRGSLHLVDLAGSERVERSEATGDRLKEAQHINKSLSALGDVISALAQKGPHVPYRNSKLTQVLQSSLGGQAKTLMFVQITPEVDSYSETISTLKFAERVSGVELGAARSNKEGRDIRRLMDQVSSLKDMVSKKDEQIEKFQQLRGNVRNPKRGFSYLRQESSSPRRYSVSATPQGRGKGSTCFGRSVSNYDSCSRYSDKQSEAGSLYSAYELRSLKDSECRNLNEDMELFAQQDGDSDERLSDISDGCLSRGAETEASAGSAAELTLFPEAAEPAEIVDKSETPKNDVKAKKSEKQEKDQIPKKANTSEQNGKTSLPSKPTTTTPRTAQARPSRLSVAANSSSKALSGVKKTTNGTSSSLKPPNRQR